MVGSAPAQAGGDDGEQDGLAGAGVLEVVGQVGVEGDAVARRPARGARRRCRARRAPRSTSAISRLPGSCIGGSPGPPVRGAAARGRGARARRAGRAAAGSGSRARGPARRCRRGGARAARTIETVPPSSRRSSWRGAARGPAAMRAATASVGLVSPRSTWLSIGALTPRRSARSRRLRSIGSRSARMRGPIGTSVSEGGGHGVAYVIAYGRNRRRLARHNPHEPASMRTCSSDLRARQSLPAPSSLPWHCRASPPPAAEPPSPGAAGLGDRLLPHAGQRRLRRPALRPRVALRDGRAGAVGHRDRDDHAQRDADAVELQPRLGR